MLFNNIELLNCAHGSDKKTVFFTITNYGYVLYTLNILKSLSKWGLDKKVLIICLDDKSNKTFLRLGYSTYYYNTELAKFIAWNKPGYDKICYYKLLAMCKIIEGGYNFFYVDGDIVFKQNPTPLIDAWVNESAAVFMQNDTMENFNTSNLCSGCVFAKSTELTKKYFVCDTPATIRAYELGAGINNDQTYINDYIKPFVHINAMLLELFPNGQYFMQNCEKVKDTAVLVHFNWLIGHDKMAKIKQYGMWQLTADDEELI